MTHTDSSAGVPEHSLYKREVRRFESPSVYQFKWREKLYCQTGVYVERWYLETPFGSVRLHHWIHSDDGRAFHDHPWWFITIVLWGSYTDKTPDGDERMTLGKVKFRPALHMHTVKVDPKGAWTFLLTGPKSRKWGFKLGQKWKKSNKYFLEQGKHVCD